MCIEPADCAAIPAAVESLDFADPVERKIPWVAAKCGCWAQLTSKLQHGRIRLGENTLSLRTEVLHICNLEQRRLGFPIEVGTMGQQSVAHDVYDDPVLGLVLRRAEQLGGEAFVFGVVTCSGCRACKRAAADNSVKHLHE